MTQEEKDLLHKDLCARLPYGVHVQHRHFSEPLQLTSMRLLELGSVESIDATLEDVKPYLLPLSSMTEEQMDKVEEILMGYDPKIIFDFMADGDIIFKKGNISIKAFIELTQYFDKEMLDYRGLIPMGLANDATGLNIY